MRRDLIVSILGHFAVVAIALIINPVTGMFRPTVPVMTVSLAGIPAQAGGATMKGTPPQKVAKQIEPEQTDDSYKLKSKEKKEKPKVEKREEPKPEPPKELKAKPKKSHEVKDEEPSEEAKKESAVKDDGKGGLEVNTKIGSGSSEGDPNGTENLPYNMGLLESIIQRSWRNPVTSSTAISCTIFFQIDRSGLVMGDPLVERSSGITAFDQSAVFAIKRANQFPPFPIDFEYDHLGIHLEFEYAP